MRPIRRHWTGSARKRWPIPQTKTNRRSMQSTSHPGRPTQTWHGRRPKRVRTRLHGHLAARLCCCARHQWRNWRERSTYRAMRTRSCAWPICLPLKTSAPGWRPRRCCGRCATSHWWATRCWMNWHAVTTASAQPTWVCWHAALAGMMYTMAWIRTGWHRSSRAVIDAGPPRPGMRQSCRHCLNKRAACGWGGSQSVVACATCRSHGTCGDPSGRRSCPSTSVKSTRCWMPSSRGSEQLPEAWHPQQILFWRSLADVSRPRRWRWQVNALRGVLLGVCSLLFFGGIAGVSLVQGKAGEASIFVQMGALLGLLLAVMGVLWVPVRWALRQLTLDLTHRRAGLLLALPAPLMAIGSLVLVHGLGHRMEGTLLIFMALPLATARLWRRVGARMRFGVRHGVFMVLAMLIAEAGIVLTLLQWGAEFVHRARRHAPIDRLPPASGNTA